MKNKIIHSSLAACFAIGLVLLPQLALAQFGLIANSPATPLYVNDGFSAAALDTPFITAINAAGGVDQGCATADSAFSVGDTAAQLGMGGLTLIGGGAAMQVQLTAKLGKIDSAITCHQGVLATLNAIVAPDSFVSQQKQIVSNKAASAIAALKVKEETVKGQLTLAQQGFWKTLVYNILIKTTQSISAHMLNNLTNNFKIKDFTKYADAVATQVYDNALITQNYSGKAEDQLLIRSMLSNPIVQNEISPAIFQRVNTNLGFNPSTVDVMSPSFYANMALVGAQENSPYVQQMVFADQTQALHAKALNTAEQEIAQSNGLKTPRTCVGTLSQQKAIDSSYASVNARLKDRQKLLSTLADAQTAGQNVSATDIAKAQADVNQAAKDLQNLPNSPGVAGKAAIDICTAIVSPPSLINQGINEALHQIGQNLGTYNDNNLPFFITAITDIATKYTNSLIFGGNVNTNSVIQEAVGAGAATAAQAINNNYQTKQVNNVSVSSSINGSTGTGNQVSINIDWDATALGNASGVAISGPGIPANMSGLMVNQLSGSIAATVNGPGTYKYVVSVYGASKSDVLATIPISVVVPAVAGVSVSRPLEQIRGPLTPRGMQ